MAQYKDIDVILNSLPNDLPYKSSVKRVLIQAPEADVVPKREVDMSQHLLKDAWKRIEELDNLCGELQKPKQEVAREIFESIEECIYLYYNKNDYTMPNIEEDIAELKKKYTEDKR